MSDKIDTVINPRTELGGWQWLAQFAIHPGLRAQNQEREVDSIRDPESEQLLSVQDDSSDTVPRAAIVSSPKPQIASQTWKALFAGSFRKTFLGDGYNPSENSVVTFDRSNPNRAKGQEEFTGGEEIRYQVVPEAAELEGGVGAEAQRPLNGVNIKGVVHVGHAIASFLGVPNRFHQLGTDGQLVFNGWTILRNYTGMKRPLFEKAKSESDYTLRIPGLGKYKYVGGEYGLWQTLALPIKLGIGLPLKLALTVVNFAVNIVKLATEFVPSLIVNGSAKVIRSLADAIADTWKPVTKAQKERRRLTRFGIYASASILIAVLGAVHYVGRVALLLGTAFTSPAKLVRDAWDFAHQLTIKNSRGEINEKATAILRKVAGVFGIVLSAALTVALWAVALPFGIAALVKYVPQFMVAVNWVLATPFIAPALAYVNGALTVVGGYLSVFLPLANALAVSAGLQMTAAVFAVGVSIGSIAAVVANIATPIVNAIGNWAALRKSNAGPISYIAALRSKNGSSDLLGDLNGEPKHKDEHDTRPAEECDVVDEAIRALILIEKGQEAYNMVHNHGLDPEHYFQRGKDGNGWTLPATMPAEPELSISEIAKSLVASAQGYDTEADKATALAEARVFALVERIHHDSLPNDKGRAVAGELDTVIGQIDRISHPK